MVPPETAELVIQAQGLTKTYGAKTAVDGIDLAVPPGQVFGLLGPNGAGKTTTILMLLGLTTPTAGDVRVCGLDPGRHPLSVKRQVGYLPDAVGFYDTLTGRQNLRYTARLNELDRDETETRIDLLLDQVGLADDADRPVGEYSRGMQQRLGVADALMKDPLVVILDEPTAAIDPEGSAEMQRLITHLAHEEKRAILLSSHLLTQVQQLCDRLAIFVAGKIIAEGSSADLAATLADGRARFEIVADVPASDVAHVLADAGIIDVETSPTGVNRWNVTLPADDAGRLLPVLVDGGIPLSEVRDLGSDLTEIYHRYFSESGAMS
jgi:ABC-2 type transport system ATP-binding protein